MIETESNPLADFLYAITSPETKRHYIKKIKNFFDFLGLEGPVEKQAQTLLQEIRNNKEGWIASKIMDYIQFHKERAETVLDTCLHLITSIFRTQNDLRP